MTTELITHILKAKLDNFLLRLVVIQSQNKKYFIKC